MNVSLCVPGMCQQSFAQGDCYVCIWKSIRILKIVQMKQISTGSITINRNDLKQTVVHRYNEVLHRLYGLRVRYLPCPKAGCQRFRSMSASKSMWFIELAVLLNIWFSAVVPLLSALCPLVLATPFRFDLPSSQEESTLSKYCMLIIWWWIGLCVVWHQGIHKET